MSLPARGAAVLHHGAGDRPARRPTRPPASRRRPRRAASTWPGSRWPAPPATTSGARSCRAAGTSSSGRTAETSFVDATVRNGTRAHYVVDGARRGRQREPALGGGRRPPAADDRRRAPGRARRGQPAALRGRRRNADPRPRPGRRRHRGSRPDGRHPGPARRRGGPRRRSRRTDYAWSEMTFAGDADGADRLAGAVRPEELGTFNVVLRVSTDDGATWAYADRGGIVTAGEVPWGYRPDQAVTLTAVARGPDTEPPPAPARPRVATVGASSLTLAWEPVTAPDLFRYEVLAGVEPRAARTSRSGPRRSRRSRTTPWRPATRTSTSSRPWTRASTARRTRRRSAPPRRPARSR